MLVATVLEVLSTFLILNKEGNNRIEKAEIEFLSSDCVRVGFRKFCERPILVCDSTEDIGVLIWNLTYYIVTSLSVLIFITILGKSYRYINRLQEERERFYKDDFNSI